MEQFISYSDFLFDQKLEIFINEISTLNESDSNIKDKIKSFISKIKSDDQAIKFLKKAVQKITNKATLTFMLTILLSTTSLSLADMAKNSTSNPRAIEIISNLDSKSDSQLKEFLEKLAFSESSDKWNAAKRTKLASGKGYVSYIGKYQLGKLALKDVGRTDVTYEKFKKNPDIFSEKEQDEAVVKLLKKNKHYLRNWMNHLGENYKGTDITMSGLLAASHLVGNGAVKKFLKSKGAVDKTDGNGISCSDYMKKFNGYNLVL